MPPQPDATIESRLTIGPRAVKDIVEHFPSARITGKNDPQLVWQFEEEEVQVKSVGSKGDTKGWHVFHL
jgi:cell cycle checkpoint control protein RAD9A